MASKKMSGRITAAVISSIMTASMFTAPISYQFTNQLSQIVSAEVAELDVKLEAADSGSTDPAPNKTRIAVPKDSTEVTFTFESDSTDDLSLGIYGLELYGTEADPDSYWGDVSTDISIKGGKGSYTYKIPAKYQGKVKKIALGLWYPKSGVTVTITSVESDGTGTPGGPSTGGPNVLGPQDAPKTENTKSGTCSFTDNGDGTATISATLTSEVKIDDSTQFDFVLTNGYDEESYLDEDGKSTYEEGDPINSHKFTFADFGFESTGDLDGVTFQSFNYTITCDEDMAKFQYGGGINVGLESPADTEYVKGKNGYWYNDQGEEDVEKYGAKLAELGIEYHGAYTVENAGKYAEIVWDVPKDVQPHVASDKLNNTVGIQYWYSNALNAEEGKEYEAIPEVHLTSASCTYTKTLTVPYNTTKNVKIGKTLTPGGDNKQLKYMLSELGLKNSRDKISAVKFNLKSSADIKKLTSGVGISVGGDKEEEFDGWYMSSPDITILEPAKDKIELMWIVPTKIRDYVDFISALGNILYGTWYTGEDNASVTLESMDFYEYISNEKEDLTVWPENMEVEVGETSNIKTNIPGCTFKSSSSSIASVDEKGAVTGVSEGLTTITITTPEGQEATIKVIVTDNSIPVTTAPVTTAKPVTTATKPTTAKPVTTVDPNSTTKPTTTAFDPTIDIDWASVLYGDVNLDTYVDTADLVMLNMYILDPETYPIKNATARENAQCYYDAPEKLIDSYDASILLNYIAMLIKYEEIGPKDKINVPAIRTE